MNTRRPMQLIIGNSYQVKVGDTIAIYVLDGLLSGSGVFWTGKCHKCYPVGSIVGEE